MFVIIYFLSFLVQFRYYIVLYCRNIIHLKYYNQPIIMAGNAIPATRPIPIGAPTKVPSCQRIFFFLDHGFLPQKVQPEGL